MWTEVCSKIVISYSRYRWGLRWHLRCRRRHGVRVLGVVPVVGESSGDHYGGAATAVALYALTTARVRAAACV